MRDTYFSLSECREEEIEQLRDELFYKDGDDLPQFSTEDIQVLQSCATPYDIPYELLDKAFGFYSFVEEDFWCNL